MEQFYGSLTLWNRNINEQCCLKCIHLREDGWCNYQKYFIKYVGRLGKTICDYYWEKEDE